MSKKSGPTPPPAPDPTVVANAQTQSNQQTAAYNQKLNMVNTYGPQGSVTYQADANAPGGYSQTTALSPSQQGIYDAGTQAQAGALGIANNQLGRVNTALGQTLDPGGVKTSYDAGGQIQTGFDQGGQLQYGFSPGQQVQGHVGPQNLTGAYQAAADASYQQAASRLDPQWNLKQQQLQSQLANQGLSVNDDAYKSAMSQFGNAQNDAYNQALYGSQSAGLNAENTIFGQGVQQGQFANAAAAQQYGQNQGQAAFNNSTAGQAYQQNLGAAQFANTAQAQQNAQNAQAAQFGNQATGQQFQQTAYSQQLPINEFNALMSSNQVAGPQGINYTPASAGSTDVLGAYALNTQANQANYQAQMQNQAALMGGLANLGGAAATAAVKYSDARLKRDIRRVGQLDNGLPVYAYRYVGSPQIEIGVIAQDVAAVMPHAVIPDAAGYLRVDYGAL